MQMVGGMILLRLKSTGFGPVTPVIIRFLLRPPFFRIKRCQDFRDLLIDLAFAHLLYFLFVDGLVMPVVDDHDLRQIIGKASPKFFLRRPEQFGIHFVKEASQFNDADFVRITQVNIVFLINFWVARDRNCLAANLHCFHFWRNNFKILA